MSLTQEDLQAIASLMDAKLAENNESLKKEFGGRFDKIETDLTSVKVTLENDIARMIGIIGDGHDFLKMRLNEALKMEEKREKMELEIILLRMQMNKVYQLLNIS